jgi:hypothetical protein
MKRSAEYVPLEWPADSKLSGAEQAHVDRERRSLWDHGIRREPLLTRMAFEFGAVATMLSRARQTTKAARDAEALGEDVKDVPEMILGEHK